MVATVCAVFVAVVAIVFASVVVAAAIVLIVITSWRVATCTGRGRHPQSRQMLRPPLLTRTSWPDSMKVSQEASLCTFGMKHLLRAEGTRTSKYCTFMPLHVLVCP